MTTSNLAPQGGQSGQIHYRVWLAVALLYTLVIVLQSLRQGSLAFPPTFDDITYFNDGLDRLQIFYNGGFGALGADLVKHPPHSPFSTLEAFLAFAIFGVHPWAPPLLNGVLVWLLLVFGEYLGRELPVVLRVTLVASTLSWPLTENLILECRPDIIWGLLSASTIILIFEQPWLTSSPRTQVVVGCLIGLALLTKASTFPVTLTTVVLALLVASLIDWIAGTGRQRLLAVNALTLGVALVVALPYYLMALPALTEYIVDVFGSTLAAWEVHQSLQANLTYYLTGPGGAFMLGAWWWVWLGLVSLCAGVVLRGRRGVGRGLGLAVLVGTAYLIVTVSAVKGGVLSPFFGVQLQSLILLNTVQMVAWLHGISDWGRGWLKTLGMTALGAIALGGFHWPLRNLQGGETIGTAAEIKYRRGLVELIYQTITRDAVYRHGIAHLDQQLIQPFFVGVTPYLNDGTLDFVSKRDYFPDRFVPSLGIIPIPNISRGGLPNVSVLNLWLQQHSQNPNQVPAYVNYMDETREYVVAFSADDQDLIPYLPAANLQAQLLAALDQDPNFNLLQTYPNPYGGGKVLLYVKTPPFAGLSQPTNLGPPEKLPGSGPWSGRWGLGPRTTFGVKVNPGQSAKLVLTATALTPGQVMSIKVDGQLVSVHRFTKLAQYDSWEVPVPPGAHRIEINYQHWTSTARDPRPLAVLFKELKLFSVSNYVAQANGPFVATYSLPSPFQGLANPVNLGALEGPYPQLGATKQVRWGLGPVTSFQVNIPATGAAVLQLRCLTLKPGQVMTIRLDGTRVYVYHFPRTGQFQDLRVPLAAQPGIHQVEIAYRDSAALPPDPRPLAVLFEKLKVTGD